MPRLEHREGHRTYAVLIADHEKNVERIVRVRAVDYAEALMIVERRYQPPCYGIPYDAFDLARAEGIAFNEADGLLIGNGRQE